MNTVSSVEELIYVILYIPLKTCIEKKLITTLLERMYILKLKLHQGPSEAPAFWKLNMPISSPKLD